MDPVDRLTALVNQPTVPLAESCLVIAACGRPELDIAAELDRLAEIAGGCADPSVDGLREHLFDRLRFRGNLEHYYSAENSYLDRVMTTRQGIPITLCILTIEVGRHLGLDLVGVGMPGHFLVGAGEDRYIDAFDQGVELDVAAVRRRFAAMHGEEAEFDSTFLRPVGTPAILFRVLNNLRGIFQRGEDRRATLVALEMQRAIPGAPPQIRVELANALAAVGRLDRAAGELEAVADLLPESDALRAQAAMLRARLN